jgi:hypothetical protein
MGGGELRSTCEIHSLETGLTAKLRPNPRKVEHFPSLLTSAAHSLRLVFKLSFYPVHHVISGSQETKTTATTKPQVY